MYIRKIFLLSIIHNGFLVSKIYFISCFFLLFIFRSDSVFLKDNGKHLRCLEKAFIGNSDFDIESSKLDGCIDDESSIPVDEDVPNVNGNPEDSEDSLLSGIEGLSFKKGSNPAEMESFLEHEKDVARVLLFSFL